MQIVVYEPFQHFIPTGQNWIKGFRKLGHDAFALPSNQYSILQLDDDPDILVMFGPDESKVSDIVQFKKQHPKTKLVIVCFNYKPFYQQIEDSVNLWVEHVHSHEISREEFEKKKLPFAYIPLAADPDVFFPIVTEKKYPTSFIGQLHHGDRDEKSFLFPVIDKYPNGFYSGFQYKGKNYPCISYNEINHIYNSTKVNVNFHYPDQRRENPYNSMFRKDFNGRVFEIAMSGNFQLCDIQHVEEVGLIGLIAYGDKSNWLDIIDYYLKNDSERIEMATKAREQCLKFHTWETRMKELVKNLGL